MDESPDLVEPLMGKVVVLDLRSPYVVLGKLVGCDARYWQLEDADVHDLRASQSTRDYYVMEAKANGIQVNRTSVLVPRDETASLAALESVQG